MYQLATEGLLLETGIVVDMFGVVVATEEPMKSTIFMPYTTLPELGLLELDPT